MDTERMKTSLVALGGMAGALTAIWGAAKLIVIVPEAIKKRLNARRERKEATMRELIRRLDEQWKMLENITRRTDAMEKAFETLNKATERIEKNVETLDKSIATLQCDRLNQAYVYYVDRGNPCPMDVKMSLTSMCKQYRARGHNHLSESYIERLEQCPTK